VQKSRQAILTILKQHGQLTMTQLRKTLDLTPVTIRYHLNVLQGEKLVNAPKIKYQKSPGRPEHLFSLNETAYEVPQKNGDASPHNRLSDLQRHMPHDCAAPLNDLARQILSHLSALAKIVSSQGIDTHRLEAFERCLARDIRYLKGEAQ